MGLFVVVVVVVLVLVLQVLIKLEREGRVTAHEPDSDGAVLTLAPTPASPFDPYYRTLEWKWTDQAKM